MLSDSIDLENCSMLELKKLVLDLEIQGQERCMRILELEYGINSHKLKAHNGAFLTEACHEELWKLVEDE